MEKVMIRVRLVSSVIVVVVVAVLAIRVVAQGQAPPPANQDTLGALLVEVRGLRSAMEQLASAGPRIQLAMGRLQLQEQRVNTLIRRADELRQAVAATQNDAVQIRQEITRTQEVVERGENAADRPHLEAQLGILKQTLARKNAEIQRLQGEEGEIAAQVSSEQARWVEINQRLEELDRALTRSR
jgi:predicted  nucleic acid-binding Zn-ribbon protein